MLPDSLQKTSGRIEHVPSTNSECLFIPVNFLSPLVTVSDDDDNRLALSIWERGQSLCYHYFMDRPQGGAYVGAATWCRKYMPSDKESLEFEFEWRFYAQSASEAIFRARAYNRIIYPIHSGDDDYLMNVTRRKPTTGVRCPTLFDKCHEIVHMPSDPSHTYRHGFVFPVIDHWGGGQIALTL